MTDTDHRAVRVDPTPDNTAQRTTMATEPGVHPAPEIPMRKVRETKPSLLTSELWLTLGGIAALIVVYIVEDDASLDLFRTCLLATLLGVSYVVSRGIAKSGSRTRWMEDPRSV